MKFIKKLLVVLLGIIVLGFLAALFIDRNYEVERHIQIDEDADAIYTYIKYLRNQENYSVWAKLDEDMQVNYTGEDATSGFIYYWKSNKEDVGEGEQEIRRVDPESRMLECEVRFKEPMESKATLTISVKEITDERSEVTWKFQGKTPYPMNILNPFIDFEKYIGKDLDQGLRNLKIILE